MRCERARPLVSAMVDGEAAPGLKEHLDTCRDCQAFCNDIQMLRRTVRIESLGTVPDLVPRVLARLPKKRPGRWLVPAAGALAGLVIGVLVTGGGAGPRVSLAATVPEEVMAGQTRVDQLSGSFIVTERIRPGVARLYSGELIFHSPESLSLIVTQTSGPPGWLDNSFEVTVDVDVAFSSEPFPCPSLDGCTGADSRQEMTTGRDPFSAATAAPLDLVVPASVFRNSEEPARLPDSEVAGREVIGMEVTAAQARPLLESLFGPGNWREIHNSDRVSLWLDTENYTPLALAITAGQTSDRAVWGARRGYIDPSETPYLELSYGRITYTGAPEVSVAAVSGDIEVDAGFRPVDLGTEPGSPGMPLVISGRVEGPVPVEVWAWSDGRAWVRLDRTTDWNGQGLFGNFGGIVEVIDLGEGTAYRAGDGSAVFVHGDGVDVVAHGSVDYEILYEVAASTGIDGLAVPADWPENSVSGAASRDALLPGELPGFGSPIVRIVGDAVVIDLIGSASRAARVTQQPGTFLRPPLDPDARTIRVRGVDARFSPALGLLEWIEDGAAFSVGGEFLVLDELLEIAQSLERR